MMKQGMVLLPMVLTLACGSAARQAPRAAADAVVDTEQAEAAEADTADEDGAEEALLEGQKPEARKLGDYFVYRYSGAFTAEPLTLVEQVVAEEFGLLVVDLVLEQGDAMEALRVRMKPSGHVVSVASLGPDGEGPADLGTYERMMSRTQFLPDSNDETLGADDTTCLVGTEEVDCTTTTYAVRVGDKEGVLSVTKSEAVPGRDLGGEVLGSDGAVLYRAELVERGNQEPATDAVAWGGRTLRFVPGAP